MRVQLVLTSNWGCHPRAATNADSPAEHWLWPHPPLVPFWLPSSVRVLRCALPHSWQRAWLCARHSSCNMQAPFVMKKRHANVHAGICNQLYQQSIGSVQVSSRRTSELIDGSLTWSYLPWCIPAPFSSPPCPAALTQWRANGSGIL